MRVARKLCDLWCGGWRAGRILDKWKPQRGWTGQDVLLIIQQEVKVKAILKKKQTNRQKCIATSKWQGVLMRRRQVTYIGGDAGSSVGDEEDRESRISEDTVCTLRGNEWTPASVHCECMFFQSVSVYKGLRFSVAPQHYLWDFRDFQFQIEKPYTFPGHLQHFSNMHTSLWQLAVWRGIYASMHFVVRQLDHNYCDRVIYKSVISITMWCRELYNDANYRAGVLSLAFPSTTVTTEIYQGKHSH